MKARPAEYANGYCVDCGRYLQPGIVLGDVEQNSGFGPVPVICRGCEATRSVELAARMK